jgi:mannitol/fructose-specific phosphotransferase system IIA component (Ntr-type)
MRETLDTFVSFMLAPIFFGAVCISANFVTDFSADVVFSILFLSCAGKLLGGFIGAKLAKSSLRDSFAIAVCMNARGAMELILAQVALDAGIIDGKVFVALVFMAIVTSVIPGPLLRRILKRPSTVSISSIIPRKGFVPRMTATSMQEAIKDLAVVLKHPELAEAAIERECAKNQPSWDGLSVASVVSKNLTKPLAALGIYPKGLKYGTNVNDESELTKFMVLLLIPESKHTVEFDLMREVSQLFTSSKFQDELLAVKSHVELQALFQIEKYRQGMAGHNPNVVPVIAVKETGMIAVDVEEIINGSPRASPSSPSMMLSPRAMETLQPHILEMMTADINKDGEGKGLTEPLPDIESFAEFPKRRIMRKETSKSLRETIEDYITSPPGTTDAGSEPSDVMRRLSVLREGHHVHEKSTSDDQSVSLYANDTGSDLDFAHRSAPLAAGTVPDLTPIQHQRRPSQTRQSNASPPPSRRDLPNNELPPPGTVLGAVNLPNGDEKGNNQLGLI